MNWAMPCAPAGDAGEGVEVRLGHQLGGEQGGGDVPVCGGPQQRRPEARRDERGQARRSGGRAIAPTRSNRISGLAEHGGGPAS